MFFFSPAGELFSVLADSIKTTVLSKGEENS